MKNIMLSIIFCLATLMVVSQTDTAKSKLLVSKKGIPILPQKGDISLGTDAEPFLQYLGNMHNADMDNYLTPSDVKLYGKYFLKPNEAVRAILKIANSTSTQKSYVRDDAAFFKDPLSRAQAQDWKQTQNRSYLINIAYLKYRGYGRLRGFYGPHIGYSYYKYKNKYSYGNPMSAANPLPTSTAYETISENGRVLINDNGATHKVFIGGTVGVEYYIFPKICIGAEFNLSIARWWQRQSEKQYERFTGSNKEEYNQLVSPGSKGTDITTTQYDNFGGLYLMFTF